MTADKEIDASPHILFRVGNTHWAIDVASVKRAHNQLSLQPVPGTKAWFLGLAEIDGQLLPVTDLGAWLGHAPAGGAVLQLRSDISACGLRVDEVLGAKTLSPSVSVMDSAVMPGATSLVFEHANTVYRQVDVNLLVQSPAFVAIREAVPA